MKDKNPIRIEKGSIIQVDGANATINKGDSAIIDPSKMKRGILYPAVLNGQTFFYCKI
jgi:hypothetical protein